MVVDALVARLQQIEVGRRDGRGSAQDKLKGGKDISVFLRDPIGLSLAIAVSLPPDRGILGNRGACQVLGPAELDGADGGSVSFENYAKKATAGREGRSARDDG
ncbi:MULTISPECIES: hypothetical protein [Bradyrhizobium]|uniref:hypothetical protein n=1 Tax=Bradyrhizobium TaxID=374 RepID=UPI001F2EC96A|nr:MULTISPECIES: hypothetical protein [Bradyrhizobium]